MDAHAHPASPHVLGRTFFINSVNGPAAYEKAEMNLLLYPASPEKARTYFFVFGRSVVLIFSSLSSSICRMPFPSTCPVKAMLSKPIKDFDGFRVTPASLTGENVS